MDEDDNKGWTMRRQDTRDWEDRNPFAGNRHTDVTIARGGDCCKDEYLNGNGNDMPTSGMAPAA